MTPRIDAFAIIVTDMAASLAFYRRLGLEFPAGAEGQGHVEATLPGGLRLMFDTVEIVRSFDANWQPPAGGHRMSLAFVCDDVSDVDKVHADLVAAGYVSHLAPFDAFWGQRYATVYDPDGNPVDLFAARPA
jgi:uncharacterized glyoxalase superfamily protein PhnB